MAIEPTPWQARLLGVPESYDLVALCGRGAGKSFAAALMLARHAAEKGRGCRALFARRTRTSMADFHATALEVFSSADPKVSFNRLEGRFEFSNGAVVITGELEDDAGLRKYTGASLSYCLVDEVQQQPSPRLIDRLFASLRLEPGRLVLLGHGGDSGAGWLQSRFVVDGAAPWEPFTCRATGRPTVRAAGNFRDNPHIDANSYEAALRAAVGGDEVLLRAWLEGDVEGVHGAFFGGIAFEHVFVDPWPRPTASSWWASAEDRGWRFDGGCDWGQAAPAVFVFTAEAPGDVPGPDGKRYPAGSLIVFDEVSTARADDPSRGLGWPAYEFAGRVARVAESWGVEPRGVCDPSMGSDVGFGTTIRGECRAGGLLLRPAARLGRPEGWALIRSRLAAAATGDRPAIYIARNCRHLAETLPTIPRSQHRIEDVDTQANDHAADALRYAIVGSGAGEVGVEVAGFLR